MRNEHGKRYGRLETLVATTDLARADEFLGTWSAAWVPGTKSFYVGGKLLETQRRRRTVYLHRWVLGVTDPKMHVDHVLHDTLDNCRWALEIVTSAENHQNKRMGSSNTSGTTGVGWHARDRKWQARITVGGSLKHLGYFDTLERAVSARQAAELEYYTYKAAIS